VWALTYSTCRHAALGLRCVALRSRARDARAHTYMHTDACAGAHAQGPGRAERGAACDGWLADGRGEGGVRSGLRVVACLSGRGLAEGRGACVRGRLGYAAHVRF